MPKGTGRPLVFISCGQVTDEEKRLGQSIRRLVEEITPFRAYFAENQMDLDGLTNHIFRNLYDSHGLIAVMHERGTVTGLKRRRWLRGSVWIEQEIAIAAFMRHILSRPLNVALFTKVGIALEGAREKLILNPFTFYEDSDVLDRLRVILPTWEPIAVPREYDVAYRYKWFPLKEQQDSHQYRITFYVKNSGAVRATDYRLEVQFPTEFMYDTDKGNGYRRFVFSQDQFRGGEQILYPKQEREAFSIDYYVDNRLWRGGHLESAAASISLHSGDMPPKTEHLALRSIQSF